MGRGEARWDWTVEREGGKGRGGKRKGGKTREGNRKRREGKV